MATLHSKIKQEHLNMRINSDERDLLDRAAKLRGQNRSEFILSVARREAEETILEQAIIKTSPDAYAAFLARLDENPIPNERLIKTMQTIAPWDKNDIKSS